MPARDRVGGDQAMGTQCAGQPPHEHGEHGPVRPVQARAWVGAAEDGAGLIPQEILDEHRAKLDERIKRWRGIHGEDEPTWPFQNAKGLVGFVNIGPNRDNDTDIRCSSWHSPCERVTGAPRSAMRSSNRPLAAGRRPCGCSRTTSGRSRSTGGRGSALDGRLDEHDEGQHARMVAGSDAANLTTVMISPTPRSAIVLANGVSLACLEEPSGRPGS
jgi:hypothetical protein